MVEGGTQYRFGEQLKPQAGRVAQTTEKHAPVEVQKTGAQLLNELHGKTIRSFHTIDRYDGVEVSTSDISKKEGKAQQFKDAVLADERITRADLVDLIVRDAVETSLGKAIKRNNGRISGSGGFGGGYGVCD